MNNKSFVILTVVFSILIIFPSVFALDNELSRRTINGLHGFNLMIEDMQPNIERYAEKAGLTKKQLQTDIETKLKSAGIKLLTSDEWLKVPGKPVLYINVNTHEYEKYWYAYDIKVEARQIVSMEANPSVKTLASTWSINMTGIANIGTLNSIRNNLGSLVDRFVDAYKTANGKK